LAEKISRLCVNYSRFNPTLPSDRANSALQPAKNELPENPAFNLWEVDLELDRAEEVEGCFLSH
jgi:hypothetical protein